MNRRRNLPDSDRCMKTDSVGRRCRSHRLAGGYSLCYYHWNSTTSIAASPAPSLPPLVVAERLIPAGSTLDSPESVKALLTGVIREVIQGNLSTKQAAAVGYLGQTVLTSLRHIERTSPPSVHPMLNDNPEATLDQLTQSLQSFITSKPPADAPPAPSAPSAPEPRPALATADSAS